MSVMFVCLWLFSEWVRRYRCSGYSSEAKVFLFSLKKQGALNLARSALDFFLCVFCLEVVCSVLKDLKYRRHPVKEINSYDTLIIIFV